MDRARLQRTERWVAVVLALLLGGWTLERLEREPPSQALEAQEALRACRSAAAGRWPLLDAPPFGADVTVKRLGPAHYRLTSELRDQHTSLVSLACEAKRAAGGWEAVDLRLSL
jgi:hypothetical protein